MKEYLNTSYVNVNLEMHIFQNLLLHHLNTSYVNVNQAGITGESQEKYYLNTSYVNVNPLILSHSYISIILFSSHSIKLL